MGFWRESQICLSVGSFKLKLSTRPTFNQVHWIQFVRPVDQRLNVWRTGGYSHNDSFGLKLKESQSTVHRQNLRTKISGNILPFCLNKPFRILIRTVTRTTIIAVNFCWLLSPLGKAFQWPSKKFWILSFGRFEVIDDFVLSKGFRGIHDGDLLGEYSESEIFEVTRRGATFEARSNLAAFQLKSAFAWNAGEQFEL